MIADGFYNMDCFEGFPQIVDKSVDMIFCDLPFGITQCKWDTPLPLEPLWQQYKRIIKDNGVILLFGVEPFSSHLRLSNLRWYRYDWIWQKTNPKGHLNAKKQPMRAHEIISVFYKNQPTYHPQMTHEHQKKMARSEYTRQADGNGCYGKENRSTFYDSSDRYPIDIQVFSNGNQIHKIHPTEKPVKMLEYFILTYTDIGDLVLDNCAGSCSTGKAAYNTGRRFIGFEKEKEIYKRAYESWKEHINQVKVFDLMEK